jgi:hypothetical protein
LFPAPHGDDHALKFHSGILSGMLHGVAPSVPEIAAWA